MQNTFDVTLEHRIDGELKRTRTITITAKDKEAAKEAALDAAESSGSRIFLTMLEGEHLVTVIDCKISGV